jgi:hypothetical protein
VEEDEPSWAQPTNLVRWKAQYPVSYTEATTEASAGTTATRTTSAEASSDSDRATLRPWAVVEGWGRGCYTHGLTSKVRCATMQTSVTYLTLTGQWASIQV